VSEWAKVVTNPLGLVGFALFLVFNAIARFKRSDEKRWIARVFVCMAIATLVAGFVIAWDQVHRPAPTTTSTSQLPAPNAKQNCESAEQKSEGAGSPNVNCVQGNVTITVDQNPRDNGAKSPPEKK
jgi:hypothetical protein